MKLEEALNVCQPTQYLARDAWRKNGSIMRLVSSCKTIKEFKISINLTPESLEADDWGIYEVQE
jgi:hypothetical protein